MINLEYYELSIAKAISLGYRPVNDSQAWGGKCYQKKVGKKVVKWILFHPALLLEKLNLTKETNLIKLGYSIDDFYRYHPAEVKKRNAENQRASQEYEYEQNEHTSYLLALGGVHPDEVDDDELPELIRQLGP
ncbi:hypothetical protein OHW94_10775 [Acinetobacter baumannii]|nr:hypothetical protein [Acinetobacter baumannii]